MCAMELLQSCLILVALTNQLSWDFVSAGKVTCPKVNLPNGRARLRTNGKFASFKCKKSFELVGAKFAVCLDSGQWSQPVPNCVGTTCPPLAPMPNMIVQELYKGGVLKFTCGARLTRSGPESIMCDGTKWSSQPPKCIAGTSLGCDFEEVGLCGWNQDFDDDFDWTWHTGETPTAQTGPRFDHTTNSSEGHYLFMESSGPQISGQKTRIISPSYAPADMINMCLEFYYHMFGEEGVEEVGDLDVYLRPLSVSTDNLGDASEIFHQAGNQGDLWLRADVRIPKLTETFQIVFQATRRNSWSGDIAIDDVRLYVCPEETTTVIDPSDNDDDGKDTEDSNAKPAIPPLQKTTTTASITKAQVTDTTSTTKMEKPTSIIFYPPTIIIPSSTPKMKVAASTSETTATSTSKMKVTASTSETTAASTKTTTEIVKGTSASTTTTTPTTVTTLPTTTTSTTTPSTTTTTLKTTTPKTTTLTTKTATITPRITTLTTKTATTSEPQKTVLSTSTTTTTPATTTPLVSTPTSQTPTKSEAKTTSSSTPTSTARPTSTTVLTTATATQTPHTLTSTTGSTEITEKITTDIYTNTSFIHDKDHPTTILDSVTINVENTDNPDETDNGRVDTYDYENHTKINGNDDDGSQDNDENEHNSDEDKVITQSPDFINYDSTDIDIEDSTLNNSSTSNNSQLYVTNTVSDPIQAHDGTTSLTTKSSDEGKNTDDPNHGAVKSKDQKSSSNTTEMLPLIVGVASAVLVAAVVIAILAYVWARNQRRKHEKDEEDQMNIITEYVETNLSL